MISTGRFDPITAGLEAEIVRRHVVGQTAAGICDDLRAGGLATLDLWQVHEVLARNGRRDIGGDAGEGGPR